MTTASIVAAVTAAAREGLETAGVRCTDPVVVACSGGVDSSVLADVCMELSRSAELGPVTLVYIDHGLRPNTAADAAVVEALAEIGGASFRCIPVDVDRSQPSLEDAARRARYPALELAADLANATWILTAHTASDQAETVLMRVVRGAGVVGLAGIPIQRGRIVRPLLGVSRAQISEYRQARDLAAIEDPSNDDPMFARNRVRHELLPRLREENPRLEEALCRLANAAAEQRAALDFAADELLIRAGRSDRVLDIEPLRAAPPAVAKRAIAKLAGSIGSETLEARHLEALLRMVRRPAKGTVQLDLPGVCAIREYNALTFRPAGFASAEKLRQVFVSGPNPPYEIRRWRAGDRMCPVRLKGRSKKLADLFGDAKVPREARPAALVVARAANGAIEWAEHVGPAWQSEVQVTLV